MIKSDKINIIVAIAMILALMTSIALVAIGNVQAKNGGFKSEPEYANKIFGTNIISIDIIADEDDWQEMLDNAINEQYIMVDIIINGEKFKNVGIRPKGNSSLTQVANSNSDRYSFRLKFDEYIKGQTCFGLESFVLNNMLGDYTYMKEYVSYDLMREAGVDAPYFSFADVKINGKNWGLYLAVELYNDSYEKRVFGDTKGMLYNVKSMDMGGNEGVNRPGGQGGIVPNMPGMQNPNMQRGRFQMPFDGQFQQNPGFQQGSENSPSSGFQQSSQNNRRTQPFTLQDNNANAAPGFQVPSQKDNLDEPVQNFAAPNAPNAPTQRPAQGFAVPDAQITSSQNSTVPNGQSQNSMAPNSPNVPAGPAQNPAAPVIPERDFGAPVDDQDNGMNRNFGGRGIFGARGNRGNSGGSLEYIDNNVQSYSAIFNNVVGKGTESDFKRVIKALKALSEGEDLETYFDVDKILRYLAAHTIVVNLDSYSSSMAQNYYIYERDGKITILPWDYNLAWGGFQNGNASSVINFPIDTPVSGVEMSSRPLIDKLFANEEYLERYHSYLQQLIENYFANGKFEEKIKELDALISDYVKNDPTAFCTYEQYKTAVSAFITLGKLRAQSVQGQLDGTIPSTTAGQNANPDNLISAGSLNLSVLGSMMGGRGGNNMNFPGGMGNFQRRIRGAEDEHPDEMQQNEDQVTPTDNFDRIGQGRQNNNMPNRLEGGFPVGFPADQGISFSNLAIPGVLLIMLIGAIVFAARFKRSY